MQDDRLGGSPEDVAKELLAFSRSAELLSKDRNLLAKHDQKWVGARDGKVVAAERELKDLLDRLDSAGVPRSQTVVRFIEREKRTLIL